MAILTNPLHRKIAAGLVLLAWPGTGLVGQPAPMSRDSIIGRIADLRRIHTPEGIEVLEPVDVNGSTQWISIRGLNRKNPILLFIHGGPGSPMLATTWAYQKPWEDFFTVVNWDQRGVGKNYRAADTARLGPTMTVEQHVQDARAVIRHVLARLGQRKLVLVGYSFGTSIGSQVAARWPELLHVWVGIGVASGASDGEAYLYNRVLDLAQRSRDTVAIRELEAIAPYPGPGPFDVRRALAVRRWVRQYDGGWYGKPDFGLYFRLPDWGPEYTADDLAGLAPGIRWAETALTKVLAGSTRTPPPERFRVPVVFLMGRYDLHTPYPTAKAYFARIRAPRKRFVTFERASHMIMFEEPGRLLLTLVRDVLPYAGGAVPFDPIPDPIRQRSP